ncbi:cupin domain-containing protein [Aeoliella sp. ICT_H6.2]|uniref:Cupin domain-containing protein n=1 Tax=Aeoliella straminimaris TaxID=2954799 RepID=A0A9X2FGK5_9BACT|nr:cupin domain-containing protein [Aeoliella straminimaris]MCO6047978.1 cupin domain-containing protein [Aeoliella straminimaris]
MPLSQEQWIEALSLAPHPEGGWFREAYRASESIPRDALPERFTGERSFSTSIYYLLGPGDFSALHRIRQDELWHFYDGSPLLVEVIHPDGRAEQLKMGRDLSAGQTPMGVVPAGSWFGAHVATEDGYSLVGCTVAPGFDFEDFEMPSRAELLEQFPSHRKLIERLTR